ncbi:response regulator [Marinobacter sp.]|uniref:response regulator n=1 Tax=Marinobacter sp. TaxID=50741 RepID=UPI002B278B44|nr:response regulator [Marinobacter sp.]
MRHETTINIFIADDDPDDRLLLQDAFDDTVPAAHLTLFEHGDALLEGLRNAAQAHTLPSLILLDLNMPGTSGRDVIIDIKADKTLRHIPIIVLTTSNSDKDIVDSYKLGANSYIVKPSRYEQLLEIVCSLKNYWFQINELPGAINYHD